MPNKQYRIELDGLRAIAVIAVILFHLGLGCPGGFVGVDVFFVISGFLITGIIQRDIQNKTFSLKEFWERRIRRIFPALCTVIITTLIIGSCFLLPNELEELGKSSVAQALLVANVFFWRDTGYFAGDAELKSLLHTWSLAVEEQFYLIFPFFLLTLKRLSNCKVLIFMSTLTLISFLLSVYGTITHPSASFFLLPTRSWELLFGCMLSLIPLQLSNQRRWDSLIGSIGVAAVVLPIFIYDKKIPFPGIAAVPPVFGTALIIYATTNSPNIWIKKLLSIRPLTFIGLISYSLYLWHWPTIVFIRMYFGKFQIEQIVLSSIITFFLSILLWRLIETPFRKDQFQLRGTKTWAFAFSVNLALIITSGVILLTRGLPFRFPNYSFTLADNTKWNGSEFAFNHLVIEDLPTLGVAEKNNHLDFIVWGDSHGMVLSDAISPIASDFDLNGKAIVNTSFLPVPNIDLIINKKHHRYDSHMRNQVIHLLDRVRPANLILVARWSRYAGYSNIAFGDEPISLIDRRFGKEDKTAVEILERNLRELIAFCNERSICLWIIKQIPETGEKTPAQNLLPYTYGRKKFLSDEKVHQQEFRKNVSIINLVFDELGVANGVRC